MREKIPGILRQDNKRRRGRLGGLEESVTSEAAQTQRRMQGQGSRKESARQGLEGKCGGRRSREKVRE